MITDILCKIKRRNRHRRKDILMKNDGLIGTMLDTSALENKSCAVGNLTSERLDLFDKIRADTVWNRTKSVISEKGLLLITSTIKTISTALITAPAGGVTNSILKNDGLV